MRPATLLACAVLCGALRFTAAAEPAAPKPSPQALEHFEKNVRPVLVEHCHSCHGPKRQQAELRLDTKAGLLKGGDGGPVVVPGDPAKSKLIRALSHTGGVKMPPKTPLDAKAVAALTEWVKQGAAWPDDAPGAAPKTVAEVRAAHWAFRPVTKPAVPAADDAAKGDNPIDAFVRAKLRAAGLTPARPADKRVLIRRVYLDLLGLPPTPEEVEAFVDDPSPEAYPALVEKLLASPHYGERWGRHWLDVARYADTKGYVFQEERRYPYAYTYRDYVIRAFNADLPYDRFVTEQLAADLLPPAEDKRSLAALGYLTLGRRFLNNVHDIIDDRIDVTMRGLQGLTVSCARCHDHKFDPIPIKDYYSLYGVFASCAEPKDLPTLDGPPATEAGQKFEAELKKLQDAVEAFKEKNKAELEAKNRAVRNQLRELEKKVEAWKVTAPGSPPRAMVLNDLPAPVNPVVFNRGNPGNRGEAVPRRFLEVIAGEARQPFATGSGRLDLARAIADKGNPLTARVLVNRVWLHHFGAGLVRTPSDFGLRGEPPTHPELLDYLAATFVEQGWSVKKLHRLILLSATYRQAADDTAAGLAKDPDNRLLRKMSRQRLDFEALRDSVLAVAGTLDRTAGGPPVDITKNPSPPRRTVYGFIDRQNLPGVFRTFDFASPDTSTAQRHATTVPQQALFLMNSPFLQEQARKFAARADVVARKTPEERIDRMTRLAYGRAATAAEVELAKRFLAEAEKDGGAGKLTAWEQYAQVLLLGNEFAFVD